MVAAGPWGGCGQGDLSQPEGCGAPSGAQPLSRCPGSARGRAGHLYCGHCDAARPLRAAPSPFPSLMAGAVAPPWGRGTEAAAPRVPGRRCCLPASKMAAGEPGAPGGSGRAPPPPPGTARVRAGARGRRPPRSARLPAATGPPPAAARPMAERAGGRGGAAARKWLGRAVAGGSVAAEPGGAGGGQRAGRRRQAAGRHAHPQVTPSPAAAPRGTSGRRGGRRVPPCISPSLLPPPVPSVPGVRGSPAPAAPLRCAAPRRRRCPGTTSSPQGWASPGLAAPARSPRSLPGIQVPAAAVAAVLSGRAAPGPCLEARRGEPPCPVLPSLAGPPEGSLPRAPVAALPPLGWVCEHPPLSGCRRPPKFGGGCCLR